MDTIGFNTAIKAGVDPQAWLTDIATAGGGVFREAKSAKELELAVMQLIERNYGANLFSTVGASINNSTKLSHNDDVYLNLFAPSLRPSWIGNLMRYQLKASSDGSITIQGKNGVEVFEDSGEFNSDARDIWHTGAVDGKGDIYIDQGGAADNVPSFELRKLYINLGGSRNVNLENRAINHLHGNNSKLREKIIELFGIDTGTATEDEEEARGVINWIRGERTEKLHKEGINGANRYVLADGVHVSPFVVDYAKNSGSKDQVVFYSDNAGFLHAIDSQSGRELYSFIPESLLKNLEVYHHNRSDVEHPYGLDGPLSGWVHRPKKKSKRSRIYLYQTMRRGGDQIYAMDVSKKDKPKLKWIIDGGVAGTDFERLGDTWSRVSKTKIKMKGGGKRGIRDVLLFAGGYDENQDDLIPTREDSVGNDIFIVDAKSGALLWSARMHGDLTGEMKYSIPSNIRAIDVNKDGLTDQFYVADMGGQVWRFDVYQGKNKRNLIKGGVIAKLATHSKSDAKHRRRFYSAPTVSVINKEGARKLAIGIGSGYRAHPLERATQDRFYLLMIDDDNYKLDFSSFKTITHKAKVRGDNECENCLYNATVNRFSDDYDGEEMAQARSMLNRSNGGWFINLDEGEKVLSSSVVFNNTLLFTTYTPHGYTDGECNPPTSTARLYSLNILDGSPEWFVRGSDNKPFDEGDLVEEGRAIELENVMGIPAEPARLKIADESGNIREYLSIGKEFLPMEERVSASTYWRVE